MVERYTSWEKHVRPALRGFTLLGYGRDNRVLPAPQEGFWLSAGVDFDTVLMN